MENHLEINLQIKVNLQKLRFCRDCYIYHTQEKIILELNIFLSV